MENSKKILRTICYSIIILIFTLGIPFTQFVKYRQSQYFTYEIFEGNKVPSTFKNITTIIQNSPSNEKVLTSLSDLVNDYTNIIHGKSTDLLTLFLITSSLLGIAIITIGIILYCNKKTNAAWAFMFSGTFSIIMYILIYVYTVQGFNI